jgi:hypothetical protein
MTSTTTTPTRRDDSLARLDKAMSREGLERGHSYEDGDDGARFLVVEYGGPLEGRAFTIDAGGVIDETDR